MASGGFLSQLITIAAFVVAGLAIYLVLKALWAEIGPMVRLLFHRVPRTLDDDDGVGLKR